MSTYINALALQKPIVNVLGAAAVPNLDLLLDNLITQSDADLEDAANAQLAVVSASPYVPCGEVGAGAGSGESFTTAMLATQSNQYIAAILPQPFLATGANPGGFFFMYKASTERELDAQFVLARARIRAFINAGQAGASDGFYVDHYVTGGKQGGFVVIFLIWRNATQP